MIFSKDEVRKGISGQTVVEYILLFSVIATLAMTVFKSRAFRDFIGPDSNMLTQIRDQLQYNYRHGSRNFKLGKADKSSYSGKHDTYYNREKNDTHFYGLVNPYPN